MDIKSPINEARQKCFACKKHRCLNCDHRRFLQNMEHKLLKLKFDKLQRVIARIDMIVKDNELCTNAMVSDIEAELAGALSFDKLEMSITWADAARFE